MSSGLIWGDFRSKPARVSILKCQPIQTVHTRLMLASLEFGIVRSSPRGEGSKRINYLLGEGGDHSITPPRPLDIYCVHSGILARNFDGDGLDLAVPACVVSGS